MRTTLKGGAMALLAAAAVPAAAQDDGSIVVETPLIHPAAGLMNEHMHEGGEFMLGLRFERTHAGGTNRSPDCTEKTGRKYPSLFQPTMRNWLSI